MKPVLHLAFQVSSLQAYNSVSLVSLLACLSQLVYSLDVWPSAERDTQSHMHTLAGDASQTSLCEEQRQNIPDQVGLHPAMNINDGKKHPHFPAPLQTHILPPTRRHVLKESGTVSNEGGGGTPRGVARKPGETRQRETKRGKAWHGGSKRLPLEGGDSNSSRGNATTTTKKI